MTERRILRYGFLLTVLAILWIVGLMGCFVNRLNELHPETSDVVGTITKIEREWKYEAPCGIQNRKDCDVWPVCCAYTITITDSAGAKTYAVAWWPKRAEGLFVGERAWYRLHWAPQPHLLACAGTRAMTSSYCDYEMAWALQSDADVRP